MGGDALLQRPDEVAIAPRHQALRQLDHADLYAEGGVHRRHLEADDAAADHQQALGRSSSSAPVESMMRGSSGKPGNRIDSEPAAMMQCANVTVLPPSSPVDLTACVARELRLAAQDSHLALPGEPMSPSSSGRRPCPSSRAISRRRFSARRIRCRALTWRARLRSPSRRAAVPWTGCSRRSGRRRRGSASARRARPSARGPLRETRPCSHRVRRRSRRRRNRSRHGAAPPPDPAAGPWRLRVTGGRRCRRARRLHERLDRDRLDVGLAAEGLGAVGAPAAAAAASPPPPRPAAHLPAPGWPCRSHLGARLHDDARRPCRRPATACPSSPCRFRA